VFDPVLDEEGENMTKHPADPPNPIRVHEVGVNDPPRLFEKVTFPVGVSSA